ncbi:MAG TPA: hypothetical protein VF810_02375 [Patescibacteria group bacterium]
MLIIIITGIVCLANYTPGTWLTGWDTLHSEFDLLLNFKRVIFGVWRGDQGLGAVAAHSHMSELPRLIILGILAAFFNASLLRYLYVFLCLIVGPLGVYFFLRNAIFTQKSVSNNLAAFLGGLFYVFNLGTVQQFFVPFEMFTTQYAALGWLFYFATKYLFTRQRKQLLIFAVVSFVSAPMAYASLLWYAYFVGLILYLSTVFLLERKKIIFKTIIIILFTVVATNAFWLLPNLYFLKNHAAEVPLASTNILFSEEVFLHNKQYGNFKDAVIFKNFLFNWDEQTGKDLVFRHKILDVWDQHLANPLIGSLGYLFFIFVVGGVIVTFWDKSSATRSIKFALLPVGLLALIMIINMTPPFSYIFDYIRDHVSLFKEGLRTPWTKFSLLLMFVFSLYFAIFWEWIFKYLNNFIKISMGCLILILFLIYCLPMWQGNLIDRQLRIKIPSEYFALFAWINSQPENGRVAPLPMHSPWGWEYYSWGYQGAGFIWFGIKQPVLARDFDRWNPANEQYYREMGTALYARDVKRVEALADAYQIRYFILDENIVFSENKPNALWFRETKDIFSRSSRFHLAKQFGKLSIYTFDLHRNVRSYIQTPAKFVKVSPAMNGGYQDQAMQDYANYIGDNKATVVYPLRNMIDRYGHLNPQSFSMEGELGLLDLGNLPSGGLGSKWFDEAIYPTVLTKEEKTLEGTSQLFNDGKKLYVSFPVTSKPLYLKDYQNIPKYCNGKLDKSSNRKVIGDFVELTALDNSSCDYLSIATSEDLGYLLIVESRNIEGLPVRFCISSHITKRCDTYTQLAPNNQWTKEIFIIPPYPTGPSDSAGFDINFNTTSIGSVKSVNDIRSIQLITFPYHRLENLSFTNPSMIYLNNGWWVSEDQEKNAFSYYTANLNLNNGNGLEQEGLVALDQAYEDGWSAYMVSDNWFSKILPTIFGNKLENHVLVNNWANGWEIGNLNADQAEIVIIFWPQYLEFAGFLLFPIPLIYVLWSRRKKRN